jgi:NADPH:quinone reductase-like Zn-dependent oxidoreductase
MSHTRCPDWACRCLSLLSLPVPRPFPHAVSHPFIALHHVTVDAVQCAEPSFVCPSWPVCRGAYPPPAGESDILGLEAAGEVVSAGPDCTLRIPVGTPVMAVRMLLAVYERSACVGVRASHGLPAPLAVQLLGSGGYSEYVVVDERLLIRVPTGLSFEQVRRTCCQRACCCVACGLTVELAVP